MVRRSIIMTSVLGIYLATATTGYITVQGAAAPVKPTTGATATASTASSSEAKLSLDFRDATIDSVLQLFSMASGKTVIKHPDVTGNITLLGKREVPLSEALQLLGDALQVRGAVLRVSQDTIEVLPVARAQAASKVVTLGDALPNNPELITYILPLHGLDANTLRTQLAPLFSGEAAIAANSDTNTLIVTDFSDHIARIKEIVDELQTSYDTIAGNRKADLEKAAADQKARNAAMNLPDRSQVAGNAPQVEVIKLKYASAAALSNELRQILRGSETQSSASLSADMLQRLRQSGVDSNQANQLLKELSSRTQSSGQSNQSSAQLSMLLGGNTSTSGNSNTPILENRVIADTHTNSLIVTGSSTVIRAIGDLVSKLDVDMAAPQLEIEVRFIPLEKADPRTVAQMLNDLSTQAAKRLGQATSASATTSLQAGRVLSTPVAGQLTSGSVGGTNLPGNLAGNANPQTAQALRDRFQALADSGKLKNMSPAERQQLMTELNNAGAGNVSKQALQALANNDNQKNNKKTDDTSAANSDDQKNKKNTDAVNAVKDSSDVSRTASNNVGNMPLALQPGTQIQNKDQALANSELTNSVLVRGAFVAAADTQSGNLVVMAAKDDIEEIAQLVKQIDSAANKASAMQIVYLQSASPQAVATAITQVMAGTRGTGQGAQYSAARAIAVSGTQTLVLTGPQDDVQEMMTLAQRLDVAPAGQSMTAVVVPLQHADPANMAAVLTQFLSSNRSAASPTSGIQSLFQSQGSNQAASRLQQMMKSWGNDPRSAERLRSLTGQLGGNQSGALQGLLQRSGVMPGMVPGGVPGVPGNPMATTPSTSTSSASADGTGSAAAQTENKVEKPAGADLVNAQGYIRVVAEPVTKSLLITSPVDALDDLRALITELDRDDLSNEVVSRVIPLEHGSAQTIVAALNQFYTGMASMSQSSTASRVTRAATPEARLYAESASNLILLLVTKEAETEVVDLIQTLDQAVEEAEVETAAWVHELHYADASNVASIINQYLRGVVSATGTSNPVQSNNAQQLLSQLRQNASIGNGQISAQRNLPSSAAAGKAGAAGLAGSGTGGRNSGTAVRATTNGQMVLVPDTRTSRILISVPKDMEEQVRQLLSELDQPSLSADYVTKQYPLEYVAATSVAQTLTQFYAQTMFNQDGKVVPAGRTTTNGTTVQIKAVASPAGDMLFVLLPKAIESQVDELVSTIDKSAAEIASETSTWVQSLQYAEASNIATVINQFLRGGVSTGGASPLPSSNAQQLLSQLQQRSAQGGQQGNQTAGRGQTMPSTANSKSTAGTARTGTSNARTGTSSVAVLVPDTRTNQLLISVAKDSEDLVRQLMVELDQPALSADYVVRQYTLESAAASSVAQTISQFYNQTGLDSQGNIVPASRTSGQSIQVRAVASPSGDTLFVLVPKVLAERVDELVAGLDKAPVGQVPNVNWIQELKYADATSISQVLSNYLRGLATTLASTQVTTKTPTTGTAVRATTQTNRNATSNTAAGNQNVWIIPEPASRRLLISVPQTLEVQLKSLLQELDRDDLTSRYTVERVELANGDAATLAQTVNQVYSGLAFTSGTGLTVSSQGTRGNGWVRIVADRVGNSLLLIMPEEAAPAIRALVQELDKPVSNPDQIFKVIRLQYADGTSVSNILTRLMQGSGGLKAVAQGARGVAQGTTGSSMQSKTTSVQTSTPSKGTSSTSSSKAVPATTTGSKTTVPTAPAATTSAAVPATSLLPGSGWSDVWVTAGPDGTSIVLSAPSELVPVVEGLIAELDQPSIQAAETRVIPLTHATATQLATTLTQVFQSTQQARNKTTTALKVVAEPSTNSLLIVGSAEDINRVESTVKTLDKPTTAGSGIRVVTLSTAQATNLATSLNQAYSSLTSTQSAQTKPAANTPGSRTATGANAQNSGSSVRFVAESGTNSLLVVGPADELDGAVAFVSQFDRPADMRLEIKRVPLSHANAAQVVTTMSGLFTTSGNGRGAAAGLTTNNTRFVSDTGTNSVLVVAKASDLDQVIEMIKQLDVVPTATDMLRIPLTNAVASDVVTVLNQVYSAIAPSLQTGGATRTQAAASFRLFAERSTNTVFAVGPKDQLVGVQELVQAMDQSPQVGYTVEVMALENTKASDMATSLSQAFRVQGGAARGNGLPTVAGVVNSARTAGQVPQQGAAGQTAQQRPATQGGTQGTTNTQSGQAVRPGTQAIPVGGNAAQVGGAVSGSNGSVALLTSEVRFVPDANTNSLLVVAPVELMDTVREVVAQLDKPAEPEQVRQITLNYAAATSVANAINQLFQVTNNGSRTASSGLKAVADVGTNKVLLVGPVSVVEEAEKVAHDLDQPIVADTSGNVTTYRVQNARAVDLAGVLNSLFSGTSATQTKTNTALGTKLATSGRLGAGPASTPNTTTQGQQPTGQNSTATVPGQNNIAQATPGSSEGNLAYQSIRVIAEPASNTLLIIGAPEVMPEVRGIIASLDIMPPQVMIEAIVIERSLDSDNDMGMQWKWDNPNTANSSLGKDGILNLGNLGLIGQKAMGAQYALLSEGLDVIMSAISSDSKTNVISTPRILAANDTPATINVVTQVPFITTKRVENNGATQETWDYKPVGVTLTVTPRIGESGQIYLEMSQTTDSFTQTTAGGNPVINTRETESSMIVQDGQTLVMGGLIRDNQSSAIQKVPILGDLPILGYFFRTNKQVDSKTELVVFIRPTIVRTQADAAALTAQDTSKFGTDLMQKAGVVKP